MSLEEPNSGETINFHIKSKKEKQDKKLNTTKEDDKMTGEEENLVSALEVLLKKDNVSDRFLFEIDNLLRDIR